MYLFLLFCFSLNRPIKYLKFSTIFFFDLNLITIKWIEVREASNLANISCLKINNRKNIKICEICAKITIKTLERRHWCRPSVLIAKFKCISCIFSLSIVDFEQIFICWEYFYNFLKPITQYLLLLPRWCLFVRKLSYNLFWIMFLISSLTVSWLRSLSYKNQSVDLKNKLMDWFYMIGTFAMKDLMHFLPQSLGSTSTRFSCNLIPQIILEDSIFEKWLWFFWINHSYLTVKNPLVKSDEIF